MAWKELLQQQEGMEPRTADTEGSAPRGSEGMISQICGDAAPVSGADAKAEPDAAEEQTILPDGYVRRTPVQVYTTAPDFRRRRIRKAIIAVIAVFLLALLLVALLKSGLIQIG